LHQGGLNMYSNVNLKVADQSIEQLASELVSYWSESGKLTLRPSEKQRLKRLLVSAAPQFLSCNQAEAFESYAETVKQQQKKVYIDAVAAIPESIPGMLNKQRVLNTCEFIE